MTPAPHPPLLTGDIGGTRAEMAVQEKLHWIFRAQPKADYGIGAHVAIVDDTEVLGRLVAVQIKSGKSWFSQPTTGGWWFRPKAGHVRYWLNHSLPVVVVFITTNPRAVLAARKPPNAGKGQTRRLAHVNSEESKDRKEMHRRMEGRCRGRFFGLRTRELRLAKPWMDLLASGERVVLEFEEWVSKSSGRGSVSIGIDHEDGDDPEILASWEFWIGPSNYATAIPTHYAWADVSLHEETYDDADWDQYDVETRIWGEDNVHSESFGDWKQGVPDGLRPYANHSGEVDAYRLELALNELGPWCLGGGRARSSRGHRV